MKRFFLSVVIAALLLNNTSAQFKFIKVGGGLTYTTGFRFDNYSGIYETLYKSPFAGIFMSHVFRVSLPIQFCPSATFLLPRTNTYTYATNGIKEKTRVSAWMFDFDGRYIFNTLDRFEFYGLAGINLDCTRMKWLTDDSKYKSDRFGINVGAGACYKLSEEFDLFAHAKYIVSRYDQFMLNAGMLINIDWLKKHEETGID
jgi:opacity protein-like surface antigen